MSLIIGIDVGSRGGEWCQARPQQQLHITDHVESSGSSLATLTSLERSLLLPSLRTVDRITKPAKEVENLVRDLRPFADQLKQRLPTTPPPRAIGFAVPYGMAVPLARAIEWLKIAPPSSGAMRTSVVEAPLAACTQWFVQFQSRLGPEKSIRILVLSPSGAGLEGTTVLLQVRNDELVLTVESWEERATEPSDFRRHAPTSPLQSLVASSAASGRPCPPDVVLVATDVTPDIASWIEGIHPAPRVDELPSATRQGVTRIAAAEALRVLHETECTKIRVERILPRSLGILGRNRHGQGFWRKLLPAGTPWGVSLSHAVELRGQTQAKLPIVVLAECTAPDTTEYEWVNESRWESRGMRLHSSWSLAQAPRGDKHVKGRLAIAARGPLWPRFWSDESANASWQETR